MFMIYISATRLPCNIRLVEASCYSLNPGPVAEAIPLLSSFNSLATLAITSTYRSGRVNARSMVR